MAYALVVSLKQTLKPLLNVTISTIQIPKSELKVIYHDLRYVKFFFNKMRSLEDSNNVEELEKQMKDLLQNAQDLIESHLSDLVHSVSEDELSISGFSRELVEVNQKLGSLVRMLKAKQEYLTTEQPSPGGGDNGMNSKTEGLADVEVSSTVDFSRIVKLDDELLCLKERLLDYNRKLEVICITGMGGIGKTTLARMVYLDPLIKEHFDICLFVEVGVECELKDLLLRLVPQFVSEEMKEPTTVEELVRELYMYLLGRRYLVVLDDMWDKVAWNKIRRYFPDDYNGSRIIYTTTMLIELANGRIHIHQKRFLSNEESWDLLCKMAFSNTEEYCSPEIEEMGKAIVEKLGGLPLAIVMTGKHLWVLERSMENWMAVAQNPYSLLWESTIPEFLHLSYTQLPQHLKACFLYLGLFPPNYRIPTSQLIKLWVAEGFIKPVAEGSLEQEAEEYLHDLVSRNLVIVDGRSSTGGIKTCRVHQLLQDLCVRKARQQKLFHIIDERTTSSSQGTSNQRRLGIQSPLVQVMESVSGVRSLVFICPQDQHPLKRFRWLRVLHGLSIKYCKFPNEVLKLVQLRYLAITFDGELPSSISRLWNLEVLIIHATHITNSSVFLPLEVWELQKLRHLECVGFDLPDPSTGHGNDLYLKRLLTLSGVSFRTCSEGVLARMPNLIKLGIRLEPITEDAVQTTCFDAVFTKLHQLESFKCAVMQRSEAAFFLQGFPCGLRKLTLEGCGFLWDEHIVFIAQLPLLQVLKLRWQSFCGRMWKTEEGKEFRQLEVLVLEDLDIELFIADETNFPRLRRLLISRCHKLKEIPSDIGYIRTLEVIEVDDCSMCLSESARFK